MQPEFDSNNYRVYFSFYCFVCGQKFNIYLGFIKEKKRIECPNCEQKLPDGVFNNLKHATVNLENALIKLKESNSHAKGWSMSLFWSNVNFIPDRPGKFDHLSPRIESPFEPFKAFNPKD